MPKKPDRKDFPEAVMPECGPPQVLENQVALVTGGSSGIGRAIAVSLAQAGARVVINYHAGEKKAQDVLAEVRRFGRDAAIIQADVSVEQQVVSMFEKAIRDFGHLDILINNAGIQKDAPLDEMTLDDWRKVMDVNLTGQFLCLREAVRHFKKKGVVRGVSSAAGKIICISSVHEVIPWAGHVNYAASKGGVMLLMKSAAQEMAPWRIRINSISPGAIRTPINQQIWSHEAEHEKLMSLIPYNRIGEPEEIGRAAVWLASDQSDYVNGVSLYVDGGMTLYPGFETGG